MSENSERSPISKGAVSAYHRSLKKFLATDRSFQYLDDMVRSISYWIRTKIGAKEA